VVLVIPLKINSALNAVNLWLHHKSQSQPHHLLLSFPPHLLVAAFAGKELIDKAYREAIEQKYRFYSFGDAMLIL